MPMDVDVCVIGAGVAGLSAAGMLAAQNLTSVILEARNRTGGRVLTEFNSAHPDLPIELGAEFIHGQHPSLYRFAEENGLGFSEVNGTTYRDSGNGLQPAADSDEDDNGIEHTLTSPELAKNDQPFQNYLARLSITDSAKNWLTSYVEGFNAADARRISTQALLHQQHAEDQIDGGRAWRFNNGYQAFVKLLENRLTPKTQVCLQTTAKRITWKAGQARIEAITPEQKALFIHAKAVVVTVPLGVLKNKNPFSAISFHPEPILLKPLHLLEMGTAVRLNLVFREPVWESAAPNGGFLLSSEKHFPVWWPRYSPSGCLLTAWSGGPRAGALPVQSPEELLSLALQTLSRLLKKEESDLRSKLELAHYHDWHSDPFSLGAYSYVGAGGFAFSQQIAAPVENTIWFAGEAVSPPGYWGTVHGATESGRKAAEAVGRALAGLG